MLSIFRFFRSSLCLSSWASAARALGKFRFLGRPRPVCSRVLVVVSSHWLVYSDRKRRLAWSAVRRSSNRIRLQPRHISTFQPRPFIICCSVRRSELPDAGVKKADGQGKPILKRMDCYRRNGCRSECITSAISTRTSTKHVAPRQSEEISVESQLVILV